MAEPPVDLTHELLRQIRSEQNQFRSEMTAFREQVEHRFGRLEADILEVKRTLRGMAYMMATFTGRLEDVETRVDTFVPR